MNAHQRRKMQRDVDRTLRDWNLMIAKLQAPARPDAPLREPSR